MGWVRAIGASCLVVLVSTGAVGAQPGGEPVPPPEEPIGPPPDPPPVEPAPVIIATPVAPLAVVVETGYPQELVLRPLILPQGGIEGSVLLSLLNYDAGDFDRTFASFEPHLRYSFGVGEVQVGASLLAYETEDDSMFMLESERFQKVFLGGRFKVSPSSVVGGELAVFNPASDFTTYAPRAVAGTKLHLSAASAAEIAVKLGVDRLTLSDEMGMSSSTNAIAISGELRVQAQLSPSAAAEARAFLGYTNPEDGDGMTGLSRDGYFHQNYGVRIVGSLSRDLDISAGFDVLTSFDNGTVKLFTVGVAARRVP